MKEQNKYILPCMIFLGIGFILMTASIFSLDGLDNFQGQLLVSGIIIGMGLGFIIAMPSKKSLLKEKH